MEGTVKWFNNAKGYGFIGRDVMARAVFVHCSATLEDGYRALHEGDRVTFESCRGPRDYKLAMS